MYSPLPAIKGLAPPEQLLLGAARRPLQCPASLQQGERAPLPQSPSPFHHTLAYTWAWQTFLIFTKQIDKTILFHCGLKF